MRSVMVLLLILVASALSVFARGLHLRQGDGAGLHDQAVFAFQVVLRLQDGGVLGQGDVQRVRHGERARQPVAGIRVRLIRPDGAGQGQRGQDGEGQERRVFHGA